VIRRVLLAALCAGSLAAACAAAEPPSRPASKPAPAPPCKVRVYCAGPMGGPKDFDDMRALAKSLRDAGFEPYLPVDDGFALVVLFEALEKSGRSQAQVMQAKREMMVAVYALDMYRLLEDCNAVVCDLNHFAECSVNPDAGTVMEASVAYAYGRPMCFYKTDAARLLPGGAQKGTGWDNPMIAGLVNRFDLLPDYAAGSGPELVEGLKRACEAAGPLRIREDGCQFASSLSPSAMPPQVARWVRLGAAVRAVKERYLGETLTPERALRQVDDVVGLIKEHGPEHGVTAWNGLFKEAPAREGPGTESAQGIK
jgi:nucleoside 2-deoxyribosyltransferase